FVCNVIGDANVYNSVDLKKINLSTTELETYDKFYIRPEKVHLSKESNGQLMGQVVSKEFYGMYTYYKVVVNSVEMVTYQSESNFEQFEIDDMVSVALNKSDILPYKDGRD